MKILRNEKGFALVLVMILAVVALMMTVAMLFMVSRGSYVSGQQKRYRTALEASRGGAEAIMDVIATRPPGMSDSLKTKLSSPTNSWGALDNSITVTPGNADRTINLGMYIVYVKVVDTVLGNTGLSTGLMKSGVVTTSPSEISGMAIPYLYTIEVLSQSTTNSTERSKLSVLYQY